ncbi:MAG: c-type cytochrome [Christiangramia sp.]|nr:c-type cytochrome [Christiangramia sp.]
MNKFRSLSRSISNFFLALTGLVSLLFLGLFLYNKNPELFVKREIPPEQWQPKDVQAEMAAGFVDPKVKYGYQLISETPYHIGPMAEDEEMRFAGNNLTCVSCHLQAGTQAGAGSWIGVTGRFPQFRGRSNNEGSIEDRVNGCMQRSMNGEKLPNDSREMKAIVAYMDWLGEDLPKEREKEFKGFPKIEIPDVTVDLDKGKKLFLKECAVCHGEDGQGQKMKDASMVYQYPPLWGPDSFNDGAGMHRVITAAQFIKSNMPFGQANWENPVLSDEEAYHLAGYINSFSRPHKTNLTNDYPDKKLKPVSTPYGPWVDDFSASQHQYGPFPPIIKYYREKYDIEKTK